MGEKIQHQYFLSKQKVAKHQIFLPVPSLIQLAKARCMQEKNIFTNITDQLPVMCRSVVAALLA